MTSRAARLAAAAYSTGSDALANAALNLARRVAPIGLRLRAMTLASLSKGGGAFAVRLNGQPLALNGQFITLTRAP